MSALQVAYERREPQDTGVREWLVTRDLPARIIPFRISNDSDLTLRNGLADEPGAWSRAEYELAAEQGWFDGLRVELVQGRAYVKMPQNTPHVNCIEDAGNHLTELLGGYRVRRQSPLPLPSGSMPEPDILVARGKRQDFITRHPDIEEVVLLIEVSDTTLHFDRTQKAADYAQAGIADYWMLNLNNRTLEVRRDPAPMPDTPFGFGYRTLAIYTKADSVAPLALPQTQIQIADLLPTSPANPAS